MNTVLDMINQGDVCSLICLIIIVGIMGAYMTANHPGLHTWGLCLAAAAFVAYCVYGGYTFRPTDAQGCLWLAFRALLAAGLTLGISWIALSLLAFAKQYLLDVPAKHARNLVDSSRDLRRKQHYRRQQQEAQKLRLEHEAQEKPRRLQQEKTEAEAKRRRDDARLRCLMLYDQHSTILADRFPRERLHEYFEQYMADSLPPDIVEERARTLAHLINECVEQDKPRQRNEFQSLAELAAFFQTQREETTQLPYDDEVKESLLTNINIQEEQTIRRFLSS